MVGHFTSNTRGNGGVATIAKKQFLDSTQNYVVTEVHDDECQHITFSLGSTLFSFANVHMSQNGPLRGSLCKKLQNILPVGTIIGGDFNMVQDVELDTLRPGSTQPYNNIGWQQLIEMQTALQLNDLWRLEQGDERVYTHLSNVQGGITQTRIDFILCPCNGMVAHYGLHASHDFAFWQGTGRADHIGVALALDQADIAGAETKRRAVPPHIFDTQTWHNIHNDV